ncbi:MAG TPA: hypothetical protein VHU40_22830 [Polyangia bacterium]|nr:hypothetical protein [Polyangia bacterium]
MALTVAGCWTRVLPAVGGTGSTSGMSGSGGSNGFPDGGVDAGSSLPPYDGAVVMTSPDKLDVLFMIDNSLSMAPLQAKMRAEIPRFIDTLADANGQLPQLHVAVISSSFGGGAWANVNQCGAGSHPGDDRGLFQQGPGGAGSGNCSMLAAGATFLDTGDGQTKGPNFMGDIRDALACTANLGDTGCGFESPFASTYYALFLASQSVAESPQNGGFLRPDARLAIVMVTNEDDCSVRGDSLLLNPAVNSVSDPTGLGALSSYRCNEFGHLCNGQPPPHAAPAAGGVTLTNCVSAETMGKTDPNVTDPSGLPDPTMGHLWPTVADLAGYLRSLKVNPNDIFVAAIAGPPTPYRVIPFANPAAGGEIDPVVDHSCTTTNASGTTEYADPAVRIHQLVTSFGANGVFYPICATDFAPAMGGIAASIRTRLGN